MPRLCVDHGDLNHWLHVSDVLYYNWKNVIPAPPPPLRHHEAVKTGLVGMLFNINSVTLHTTSNNEKYCNGNVKKILYMFHVFQKPHF